MVRRYLSQVYLFGFMLLFALNTACAPDHLPERNGIARNWQEAKKSYQDYLQLERAGVKILHLTMGKQRLMVSLPLYLFTIAKEFERLGKSQAAVKLYIRLLLRYPLLDEDNQLGVRIENRVRWILSKKQWLLPTPELLTDRMQKALRSKNKALLETVISRDFGFGEETTERIAVDYHWALEFIEAHWRLANPKIEKIIPQTKDTLWIKTTGWPNEHKIWYWVLRHRNSPEGWEWDTIVWGD